MGITIYTYRYSGLAIIILVLSFSSRVPGFPAGQSDCEVGEFHKEVFGWAQCHEE